MAESPRIKTASPKDVKKAFGVHAERVLEVIDSHADCLEGTVAQVSYLTSTAAAQQRHIDALLQWRGLDAAGERLPWWKRVIIWRP